MRWPPLGPRATLVDLAAALSPPVLDTLLGVRITTAIAWSHRAQQDWSTYLAAATNEQTKSLLRQSGRERAPMSLDERDLVQSPRQDLTRCRSSNHGRTLISSLGPESFVARQPLLDRGRKLAALTRREPVGVSQDTNLTRSIPRAGYDEMHHDQAI